MIRFAMPAWIESTFVYSVIVAYPLRETLIQTYRLHTIIIRPVGSEVEPIRMPHHKTTSVIYLP